MTATKVKQVRSDKIITVSNESSISPNEMLERVKYINEK